jgi:hypothetical protein
MYFNVILEDSDYFASKTDAFQLPLYIIQR